MTTEYDVFISYKSEDEPYAVKLQARLTAEGLTVYRDADGLALARNVKEEVPKALHASAAVVVLWSELAGRSKWVVSEAIYAWGTTKYVPLMLPGARSSQLPELLRDYTGKSLDQILIDPTPLLSEISLLKHRSTLTVRLMNKMPASGSEFLVGREAELASLDAAWGTATRSGLTRLFVIDAMGGTGKTALINEFLRKLADENWRGAKRVYCWSFYNQGTNEKRQGDADTFFVHALEWFGYAGAPINSSIRRGEVLADLILQHRTLLILDGMEPLQYPIGPHGLMGRLKHDGLAALFKRLTFQMNGMVIVTTRLDVPEFRSLKPPGITKVELNQLTTAHGVALLMSLGVRSKNIEIVEAVELLKGHALSLNLLSTYAVTRLSGFLPVRQEIEEILLDPHLGDASFVMMRRYELSFETTARDTSSAPDAGLAERCLAILFIVGLFDRPLTFDALAALRSESIEGLTDKFAPNAASEWDFAVALREAKLLLPGMASDDIDAHPLVREYFGRRLRDTNIEAFRLANARLYEHYKLKDIPLTFRNPHLYNMLRLAAVNGWNTEQCIENLKSENFLKSLSTIADAGYVAGHSTLLFDERSRQEAYKNLEEALKRAMPKTIFELDSLSSAVMHGCAAGKVEDVFRDIYVSRLKRGNVNYVIHGLGAPGAQLSALAHMFDAPFTIPANQLSVLAQSQVVGDAAFCLRALGRFPEAQQSAEAALVLAATNDPDNASIRAGILSQIHLARGDVIAAIATAKSAIEHADRVCTVGSIDDFRPMVMRGALADALHQGGRLKDAGELVRVISIARTKAEKSGKHSHKVTRVLEYSVLLSMGKATEVVVGARNALALDQGTRRLTDTALDLHSLGSALLALGKISEAGVHIEQAVSHLLVAGGVEFVPRGYLARAAFYRLSKEYECAIHDLNEAQEIADRLGLRLFQCDIALERARLALARGSDNLDVASKLIDQVGALITETGYKRRIPELALVRAAVSLETGDKVASSLQLEEAKRWIDGGWHSIATEHTALAARLTRGARSSRKRWWQRLFGKS
jgi:tetratricopeptide (TPR) repeat protein